MKPTAYRISSLVLAILLVKLSSGQNLSSQELNRIHNSLDFAIVNSSLLDKGFKFSRNEINEKTKETESRWYFPAYSHPGEDVSSYLIKRVDSNQNRKTIFFLYNPFHYRDFLDNLIRSKYRFKGIAVIDDQTYSIFKKKQTVFMVTEKPKGGNDRYFEIMVRTE